MPILMHINPNVKRVILVLGVLAISLLTASAPAPASESVATDQTPPSPIEKGGDISPPPAGPVPVRIDRQSGSYQLIRGDQPYFIKGIGGRRHLAMAAEAGANSVRTWGSHDAADILERAQGYGMTVTLGIWLSHKAPDYLDPQYKAIKKNEVQRLLDEYKRHPALLIWSLGNEINLEGADTPEAWRFVDELAALIKEQDPLHPVISVISCQAETLDNIAALAPHLDAIGINAYATLSGVRAMVDRSSYYGPYIITEWGVDGHWEARHTVWGRPIEPTSAQKADDHLQRYAKNILDNRDRCIGSYVFLWGQKQERTPTWYSMFIEGLPGIDLPEVSCPTVDAMRFNWSGNWPSNQAPKVDQLTINGIVASSDVRLTPGEPFVAQVAAMDPENDGLNFVWELMEEPTELSSGGSHEPRPGALGSVVDGDLPQLNLMAPEKAGEYRLFVYVLDQKGHVGTANIPFQVNPPPAQDVAIGQNQPTKG